MYNIYRLITALDGHIKAVIMNFNQNVWPELKQRTWGLRPELSFEIVLKPFTFTAVRLPWCLFLLSPPMYVITVPEEDIHCTRRRHQLSTVMCHHPVL